MNNVCAVCRNKHDELCWKCESHLLESKIYPQCSKDIINGYVQDSKIINIPSDIISMLLSYYYEFNSEDFTQNELNSLDINCYSVIGKCNHKFHYHCIMLWLKGRTACPLDSREWQTYFV